VGDDQADALWGQPSYLTVACVNPPSATSLCFPYQSAVDSAGNLWAADEGDNRVLMYLPGSGTATKVLGQPDFTTKVPNYGGVGAASLNFPRGVAVDSQGTLFVSDTGNSRVLVFFQAASKSNGAAADLVLGQADFVDNQPNGNTGNGGTCPAVATSVVTQCSLDNPYRLSLDQSGDLLVSDYGNHRVLLFPASNFNPSLHVSCASTCYIPASMVWGQFGSFSTNGGNQGHTQDVKANDPCPTNSTGTPSRCTLDYPTQAITDASGNLFIADYGNSRVLEYDGALNTGTTAYRQAATMVYGQGGSYSTGNANNGGVSASSLSYPAALALDPAGNLWIADSNNSRVLEFPPAVTTAGSGSTIAIAVLGQRRNFATNSQNTAGVDAGALSNPVGIAFDPPGNAYVVDYSNSRILEYLQPYPISARVGLAQGWNLIALPSQTALPYSASMVISQINQEGGNARTVAIYENGAYKVYVPGYAPDFVLAPEQGFWVLANTPSVWAIT
jgi:hypothetical protein